MPKDPLSPVKTSSGRRIVKPHFPNPSSQVVARAVVRKTAQSMLPSPGPGIEMPVKRGRGRPRKNAILNSSTSQDLLEKSVDDTRGIRVASTSNVSPSTSRDSIVRSPAMLTVSTDNVARRSNTLPSPVSSPKSIRYFVRATPGKQSASGIPSFNAVPSISPVARASTVTRIPAGSDMMMPCSRVVNQRANTRPRIRGEVLTPEIAQPSYSGSSSSPRLLLPVKTLQSPPKRVPVQREHSMSRRMNMSTSTPQTLYYRSEDSAQSHSSNSMPRIPPGCRAVIFQSSQSTLGDYSRPRLDLRRTERNTGYPDGTAHDEQTG